MGSGGQSHLAGTLRRAAAVAAALPVLAAAALSSPVLAQDLVAPGMPTMPGRDDVRCLTLAIAYEAGNQPVAGQEAVAEVVINRTRHPAFPRSVCGVVFQGWTRQTGCQFTFTCDGSLQRRLPARMLNAAQVVAERVLAGAEPARVAGALNYHANYVSPRWASQLDRVTQIGAHIFYRPLPGSRPENGRSPEQGLTSGDAEGAQAIQLYARYFDGAASTGALVDRPTARMVTAASTPNQMFMPWGLSVR